MNQRSKRIVDLLPGEKRGLLVKLLEKWAGEPMWFLDRMGKTVMELQAEARLDPAIRPQAVSGEPVKEPASIFLTGATGFLGAFLLHELTQQTHAEELQTYPRFGGPIRDQAFGALDPDRSFAEISHPLQ